MARVFITGSANGLGRLAAQTLLHGGHEVVVHVRNGGRAGAVRDLADRGAAVVVGDLADIEQTRAIGHDVNSLGRMYAVIHNAGVYSGRPNPDEVDWSGRRPGSYPDSKLFVTPLAFALARLWPDVFSNAVDPGWVPTRMGGPGAPDDLRLGHLTQEWLATSDDPDARTSGGYWHHQRQAEPHPAVLDENFQGALLDELARFTSRSLL